MSSLFKSYAVVAGVLALCNSQLLLAQGTAADYTRAAKRLAQFAEASKPNAPTPQWGSGNLVLKFGRGSDLTYRIVDGTTGETVEAQELGETPTGADPSKLQPRKRWGRSVASDTRIELVVKNEFDVPVRVFWSDFGGSLKDYGKVEPAQSRTISTFEGHQWVIDFKANDLAGVFVAEGGSCIAVVNEESRRVAMSRVQPIDPPSKSKRLEIRAHNVWLIDDCG